MTKQFKTALLLTLGIFIGISASVTSSVLATKEPTGANGLPLNELRNLSDIFSRIKSDYVEDVEDKVLLENAIKGMLSGLDPHSTYLNPDEYKELKIGTTGQFGGLGIQVGMEDGFVKVISPIDDTPAFRAGVKAGDLVIRLDDKPVKGMSLNDAVKVMR
ncbi:MAG: PDZ domain-containing protein, partial [Gammaproteobacteria bacterium]|nr:PDZ domain-containing protein [Gammaproteobacteria bacterium]